MGRGDESAHQMTQQIGMKKMEVCFAFAQPWSITLWFCRPLLLSSLPLEMAMNVTMFFGPRYLLFLANGKSPACSPISLYRCC